MNLIDSVTKNEDLKENISVPTCDKTDIILKNFDTFFPVKPLINNEDEYIACEKLKVILCALSCSSSISNRSDIKMVSDRESVYGKEMYRYNKQLCIKNSHIRTLARYVLWNYTITSVSLNKVIAELVKEGAVAKNAKGNVLYVIGLHYRVGDNSYKTDSRGRDHRVYVETVGRQAFPIRCDVNELLEQFPLILNDIPILPCTYNITYIGNRKGYCKNIAFKKTEQLMISANYQY